MLTGFIDKNFPRWAIILLTIFGGASAVYRILMFVDDCIAKKEEKNVRALVVGIIACLGPLYLVFMIVDLIKICHGEGFSFLVK